MKNFILALAALLSVACSGGRQDDAVLSFDVDDMTASEVVVVCRNDIIPVPLDQDGKASLVMEGIDASYAKVFYGNDFKQIYFERGDVPVITFDGKDFAGTFSLKGEKEPAVRYLNTVRLTALPDTDYALSLNEFMEKLRQKEKDAVQLLKANGLEDAGNFAEMEEARIRYAYAAQLLMYSVGHMIMTGDMEYEPGDDYYAAIESYMVENEEWADIDEYRSFIAEAAHQLDAANRDVTDIYPKTLAQMRYVAGSFTSDKVRNAVLHHLACAYVDNFGVEGIQDLENLYYTYVKDEQMISSFKAKYDRWDLSRPGRRSPEISAVDIDGKKWRLADFRGKYVYIDMWATWCAPCRREMPYLKALEEKLADAQIVFLGLSVDSDKSKWEEMVKAGGLTGTQLYLGAESSFQKAYKVDGIPRFILIGKDGRIIDNDMSRPSAEETLPALEALEGIR